MRILAVVFSLVTPLLVSSCGSATAVPTSPTQTAPSASASPSVVGTWRGAVRSNAQKAGTDTAVGFALNCSQRWEIVSQSGAQFQGQMSSQGSGPDSDWRCTETRPFAGAVTADNQITIEFSPSFTPGGCRDVVGGDRATGAMADASITFALPYRATCEMAPDGSAPWWDLDIATTVTLTRW